jgi:hypothetical protein
MIRKTLLQAGFIVVGSVLLSAAALAADAPLPDAPSFVKARLAGAHWIVENSSDGEDAVLAPVPQERVYQPPQENILPGFSSSTSARHPVPGATPVLESVCKNDVCYRDPAPMCCVETVSPFTRYLRLPRTAMWTWRDNAHLTVIHIIDPFNLGTIAADAAIGISLNPHSVYGPGFNGMAKYAGVSLTEDMTGEFFGTFLIPSATHQDPRYHRVPFLPVKQRILHAITQIVWTQSYDGKPMPNYGNIVGSIATAAISNMYVPGPNRQGVGNTAERLALAFGFSPTGNLIAEFFPDVASRLNLRVVIFQRILNTVSIEESGVGVH